MVGPGMGPGRSEVRASMLTVRRGAHSLSQNSIGDAGSTKLADILLWTRNCTLKSFVCVACVPLCPCAVHPRLPLRFASVDRPLVLKPPGQDENLKRLCAALTHDPCVSNK